MAKTNFPDAPEHLSQKAKDLFNFYVGLTVKAPAQIEMFLKGLQALDMADEAAELLRIEGLVQTSERSGLSRQHPAIAIQKESLGVFMKVWKTLGLNLNSYQNGYSYEDFV